MNVDIGNVLGADPGLERADLDALDERVTSVHERIEAGRERGEFGYRALDLPFETDPDAIESAVGDLLAAVDGAVDAVLTVGIGGSALGAATVSDALESDVAHLTLDNVDPDHTRRLLDDLALDRTVVLVVSRSGTTAETLANFLVVREAMTEAGVDWTDRTLVVTGEEGNLRDLADRHDLPALDVPDGVPGRFAALSAVGLAPAAIQGHDVAAVLEGAGEAAHGLVPDFESAPGYAYGAVCHDLAERGATVNAMMPYAEGLETFAEWFAQLWAESLGKDGRGQTPARALGATDQHSQLQLYRAGPRDKLVTLVRPREREPLAIPETDLEGLSYLGGSTLGDLLDAEFEATEASLAAADRPNVRIEVDSLDERGVGRLLYGMEAACICYGELAGVETFTQPAVEWGKRAARGLLGGGDFEEADAVRGKERFVVGED